jgi:hypothetical protein
VFYAINTFIRVLKITTQSFALDKGDNETKDSVKVRKWTSKSRGDHRGLTTWQISSKTDEEKIKIKNKINTNRNMDI